MSNYMPYLKFLRDLSLKVASIVVIIIVVNITVSIISFAKFETNTNNIINYTSQASAMGGILCMLLGIFYSSILFSQAISIKADRLGYIKAVIILAISFAIGTALFSTLIDIMSKTTLEIVTGKKVIVFSEMMWIEIGKLSGSDNGSALIWIIQTIVNRSFTGLLVFTVSFMFGSIGYRLKVIYNILLFVILPIVSIGGIVNFGIKNPDFMNKFGESILNNMAYLMENSLLANILKFIIIFISSIIGYKFLIKAPIKDYANDLI